MEKRNQLLLAIAIDKYQSAVFVPLSNAVRDTNRVVEVLHQRYGFELVDEPLFDGKATRRNIFRALTDLVAALDDRDDLIIYFAGHGLQHTLLGIGYWIPYDATEDVTTYISNNEIRDYLAGIRARHIFVLSDSCFSGTFIAEVNGMEWNLSYHDLNTRVSRWMMTSGGEEVVSDGAMGQVSPFAKHLLQYLGENTNELTSITDLANYVSIFTKRGLRQQPRWARIDSTGDKGGEMIFLLKEEYVQTRREASDGLPHTVSLRLGLRSVLGSGNRLPAGTDIMLARSIFGIPELAILVLQRFDRKWDSTILFQKGSLIIIQGKDEPFIWPLIQRFASWESFFCYWDEVKGKYKSMKVMVMGDKIGVSAADDSEPALLHERFLNELHSRNTSLSTCLHCDLLIENEQELMVEIDEAGLSKNVGFVHKACLTPADRILRYMV